MKNTLILCVLSSLIAAGITYFIMKEQSPNNLVEFIGLQKNDPFLGKTGFLNQERVLNWKGSDSIDLKTAGAMVQHFEDEFSFFIPTAWTFNASDMIKLVSTLQPGDRVKMYAGVKQDDTGDKFMTLILLGNKAGKDVTQTMFEYADPCPPKCGVCDGELLSDKGCFVKRVATVRDYKGDCGDYKDFN